MTPSRRVRLVALLAGGAVAALVGAASPWGRDALERAALHGLARYPADARCEGGVGLWAAVVQGRMDAAALAACGPVVGEGVLGRAWLRHLAAEPGWHPGARRVAVAALARGGGLDPALGRALLEEPTTPPEVRRSAARALMAGPGGDAWTDAAAAVAAHGLAAEVALARAVGGEAADLLLAAEVLRTAGEEGLPDPTRVAEGLGVLGVGPGALTEAITRLRLGRAPRGIPDAWEGALRSTRCTAPCAELVGRLIEIEAGPEAAVPAVPLDAVLTAIAGEGTIEEARAGRELAAVDAWIAADEAPARRLRSAWLHLEAATPTPAEAWAEQGSVLGALRRGRGSPGLTAWAALRAGTLARVPVAVWADGAGVVVRVAEVSRRVEPCAAVRAVEAVDVPPRDGREVAALALVEAVARSLRWGEQGEAERQLATAEAWWPGHPAVRAAAVAVRARAGDGPGLAEALARASGGDAAGAVAAGPAGGAVAAGPAGGAATTGPAGGAVASGPGTANAAGGAALPWTGDGAVTWTAVALPGGLRAAALSVGGAWYPERRAVPPRRRSRAPEPLLAPVPLPELPGALPPGPPDLRTLAAGWAAAAGHDGLARALLAGTTGLEPWAGDARAALGEPGAAPEAEPGCPDAFTVAPGPGGWAAR